MKLKNQYLSKSLMLALIIFAGFTNAFAQINEPAEIITVADNDRRSMEIVIKDYLLTNPHIIREALQVLQIREQREAAEKAAENMRSFKQAIFEDPDSPVVGNENGDVSLVVFFDYNCGYCKQTVPALSEVIVNDPSLRIVYKEFPILSAGSHLAAQAALAAKRQNKYAEFHHALMSEPEINEQTIKAISDSLDLDFEKLQKDMTDPAISAAIDRNLQLAATLGVNGTPAYIIGDQMIPGAIDSASIERLISIERSKLDDAKNTEFTAGANK